MIRALIADDEPLAREALRMLLANERDVELIGECVDGRDAIVQIGATAPDLLFLDIQMPEAGGFDVIRAVGVDAVTAIVFVTAFDQHALEAFHVHAVDYLLKPVAEPRFAVAMSRARRLLRSAAEATSELAGERAQLTAMLDTLARATRSSSGRLAVRVDGRTLLLRHDEIDRIEADGNYARLIVRGRPLLVRETLGDLEAQLAASRFVRVHRSTILNLDRVKEIQPMFKGEHVVIMADGGRFSLSRKYRGILEGRLGKRI